MSSRNKIVFGDDALTILPRGLDKLLGFQREIVLPYEDIGSAWADAVRVPVGYATRVGTDLGFKRTGTFIVGSKEIYMNVSGSGPTLSMDLRPGAQFNKIILSISDSARLAEQISSRL